MPLTDYQLSFNGLTIGQGTAYEIRSVDGLESFGVRSRDSDLANLWGNVVGDDLVDAKSVIVDVDMVNDAATVLAFETAFLPTVQRTLGVKFPGRDELQTTALCRKRAHARTVRSDLDVGMLSIPVQLFLPDPRLYSAATNAEAVPPFTAGSLGFDLTVGAGADLGFDLTVGSGADLGFDLTGIASFGTVICTNDGNVDTYPTILVGATNGISRFRLTNDTNGDVLTVTQTINTGETLTIDMGAGFTGRGGLVISLGGASRYSSWEQPRSPFRLAPGNNSIRFEVLTGNASGAAAIVAWLHAWL